MNSFDFKEYFDFFPFRRIWGTKYRTASRHNNKKIYQNKKLKLRPHFSFRYSGITWHIDSSKGKAGEVNLITHAHSDHHGQKNLENLNAIASKETAKILEVCCSKKYRGKTFEIGETIKINGVKIRTYPTYHMHGSSAFLFDNGVLITGDVKDYRKLPKCKVLVTEATYGSPEYNFEEEIDKLRSVGSSTLGAYPIGKSQRVAKILLDEGYSVKVEGKAGKICRELGIEVDDSGEITITSPKELYYRSGRKYILTAQNLYKIPKIVVSDHLNYSGILSMIEHCKPECVIIYHGNPGKELIDEIRGLGCEVTLLNELIKL